MSDVEASEEPIIQLGIQLRCISCHLCNHVVHQLWLPGCNMQSETTEHIVYHECMIDDLSWDIILVCTTWLRVCFTNNKNIFQINLFFKWLVGRNIGRFSNVSYITSCTYRAKIGFWWEYSKNIFFKPKLCLLNNQQKVTELFCTTMSYKV